ncbi:MAG: hypothetical protein KA124_00060 [Luteimonas sp.]|nr:hypothetical protein [Luteimonas sp.]
MNDFATTVTSFRQILQPPSPRSRRRRIGPIELQATQLEGFNDLLSSLGWATPHLTLDQVASAARAIVPVDTVVPLMPYIRAQLDRGRLLSMMVADADWQPANDRSAAARAVVSYLDDDDGLIPNWVPGVGRLDDALVVEAGWSMLAAEVFDFQDFCRLRLLEAQLRGVTPGRFPFGRPEWQAARRAEAILRSQQRILRQRFHRSAPLEPFRIR